MSVLRTDDVIQKYIQHKQDICFFCFSDTVRTFKYWKLKKNMFPYDKIAEEHMMLSTYEHISEREQLMPAAKAELEEILKMYNDEEYFDAYLENFKICRTILDHFHIHLIKFKNTESCQSG